MRLQMNKELIEKLSAIREYLLAFKALVPDDAKVVYEQGKMVPFENNPHIQKLADLAKQKDPMTMWANYQALSPYMTVEQGSRATWVIAFAGAAETYLRTGKDFLTGVVTNLVPLMLADLDDIAKKLENNA